MFGPNIKMAAMAAVLPNLEQAEASQGLRIFVDGVEIGSAPVFEIPEVKSNIPAPQPHRPAIEDSALRNHAANHAALRRQVKV